MRKMFLAMAKDIRVILIKLADRLHNMRTMKHQNPDRQREISMETRDIYAPLAHRLGIYKIKWELEDLCLRYTDPDAYYELVGAISQKRSEREKFLENVVGEMSERITQMGIHAEIEGRPKHFYSIYNKMKKQDKHLDQIYDIFACRIIVDTVSDCYAVLGLVHEMYYPMPGRFKDYIAMPKPNMYQSLHTTVIGKEGIPFEVQIRTLAMHRTAEYGIAAHWKYKESGSSNVKAKNTSFDNKLSWLRQILDWQGESKDANEYLDSLKTGLVAEEVFVFTPKGDVISLPLHSCPIDFAYAIHSGIGNRMYGAKVNGRLVPLSYELQNGDIVDILTSEQIKGPSRDWLKMVKTSQAKSKINSWFKKESRDDNILIGKENLEREMKKLGFAPHQLLQKPFVDGHKRAAGVSVEKKNFEEFKKKVAEFADQRNTEDDILCTDVDMVITPADLSLATAKELAGLEPFGEGNREPVFLLSGMKVLSPKAVGAGSRHLKMFLSYKDEDENIRNYDAIAFGAGEWADMFAEGSTVDVLVEMGVNTWNNKESLSLRVADMHFAPIGKIIWDKPQVLENLYRNGLPLRQIAMIGKCKEEELRPTGEEMGILYRHFQQNCKDETNIVDLHFLARLLTGKYRKPLHAFKIARALDILSAYPSR